MKRKVSIEKKLNLLNSVDPFRGHGFGTQLRYDFQLFSDLLRRSVYRAERKEGERFQLGEVVEVFDGIVPVFSEIRRVEIDRINRVALVAPLGLLVRNLFDVFRPKTFFVK
jgi:hypothetical protein